MAWWMLALGAATAAAGARAPTEYVDEETGATVTVVSEPLVFAHELPGSVRRTRDFVTLAAASVNQMGKVSYVLIGYFWSAGVFFDEQSENARLAREPLVLQLQDRRIELGPRSARDAGIGVPVHRPPYGSATPTVYAIDLQTMQLIAESTRPSLHSGGAGTSLSYELLDDQLAALRELVRHLNAPS